MYDGHDNYAEIARKEFAAGAAAPLVEGNLHISQFRWMLLSRLQQLLALGVGVLCFYRVTQWIGNNLRGEWGFAGVGVLLAVMFVGLICGMGFHFATEFLLRYLPRWKTLMAINGVALLAIGVGLLAPIQQSLAAKAEVKRQALQRLKQARPMPVDASSSTLPRWHQNWRERMHRTGAHAAPGVVPPMLTVEDKGGTVLISHHHGRALYVALARVRLSGTGAWAGCRLVPPVDKWGRRYIENWGNQLRVSYHIKPGKMIRFELHPDCAVDYADAPIEYRVGVYADRDGWWSDSALAEPLPAYQVETRKARQDHGNP
jgi:hypothetical protein